MIQQRVDDSLNFVRSQADYVNGFGSPDGNYFIGLEKILELTQTKRHLQVYLESFDGDIAVLMYNSFGIGKIQFNNNSDICLISSSHSMKQGQKTNSDQ